MTSKNDLINDFRAEMTARSARLTELESELHVWWEEQNAHRTEIKDVLRGHAVRLAALEKAQKQLSPDPAELKQLRTANEQLLLQNEELAAAHQRLVKRANRLASENARLRELLAVTDQHAGEIVRALAVAEGESK